MGSSIDIEKLNIIIESESSGANTQINRVILHLQDLRNSISLMGSSASNLKKSFNSVTEPLVSLRNQARATTADVRELSNAIKAQGDAFIGAGKAAGTYYARLSEKVKFSAENYRGFDKAFALLDGDVDRHFGFSDIGDIPEGLEDTARAAADVNSSFEETSRVASTMSESLAEVAPELENTKKEMKALVAETAGGTSKLSQFFASVKRIATYRLIRSAIKAVTQSFKEGLEILVEWDRVYGENTSRAAQTTDELAAKWYEVKKSLGAAAMPIIQVLQPAIEWTANLVIGLAETINQIVRATQGYSDYMKATYNYTKQTTASAKELRRVLFGFDELNVLPSQSGAGASSTASAIDYVPTEIDDEWLELGQSLKEVWDKMDKNFAGSIAGIKQQASGLTAFLKGGFTGDFRLAADGIVQIVEGAGLTSFSVIKGTALTIFDWLYGEDEEAKDVAAYLQEAFDGGLHSPEEMWETIKNLWSITKYSLKVGFENFFKNLKQTFYIGLYNLMTEIESRPLLHNLLKYVFGIDAGAIKTQIALQFTTDTYLSPDTKKLMSIISGVQELRNAGWPGLDALPMPQVSSFGRLYASGGDPVKGTLFYAGEAGAEVVANTPGGTGVMNMQQMQDAVSNGNAQVVNAVGIMANMIVQAIQQKDLDLYIGDDAIGVAATRYQNGRLRATGVPVTARG